MRLLKFGSHGELSQTKDLINRIPDYAILSHTWGADDDEVTFDDLKDGSGKKKPGYVKIQFCAQQAQQDCLQYFWVDTCCIYRGNSAELSEAINSMYSWYREAKLCYVYLEDVELEQGPESLRRSKWFSRGWTLQELIAPTVVQFYDRNWRFLGDKTSLSAEISQITGIDPGALETWNIHKYSVAQKMSWAAQRLTTRVEDIAYCLMGLFDINMPLLYGEREKAFRRLQEEIIKNDDDHTIFAWSMDMDRVSGLLAPSPAHFAECGWTTSERSPKGRQPFSVTNRGLSITLKITPWAADTYLAYLECSRQLPPPILRGTPIGIFLRRLTEDDQYARVNIDGKNLMLDAKEWYWRDDRPQVERQLFVRHHVDQEEERQCLRDRIYGFRVPRVLLPPSAPVLCAGGQWRDGLAVLPTAGWGLCVILDVSAERQGVKRIALGFDFDFNPICLSEDLSRDENAIQFQLEDYLDWCNLFSDDVRWCEVHEGSRVYRQKHHDGIWAIKGHRIFEQDVMLTISIDKGGPILKLKRDQKDSSLVWEVSIE